MKINQKGYSLIELITVIAIFIIIFTITVVSFRQGERTEELRLATDLVATTIRKVQTQALAGIGEATDLSTDYGLIFLQGLNQFIIFKDLDKDKIYDAPGEYSETITLPETVTITEIPTNPLFIIFSPPHPTIYINGETALSEVEIKLNHSRVTNKQGVVNLNRITGRVNSELISIP